MLINQSACVHLKNDFVHTLEHITSVVAKINVIDAETY